MARAAGAKNRLTEYADKVRQVLEEQGHDPLQELVKQAKHGNTTPELRFAINKELAQYIAPKLKAIEMSGEMELDGEIQIVSYKDAKQEDMDR